MLHRYSLSNIKSYFINTQKASSICCWHHYHYFQFPCSCFYEIALIVSNCGLGKTAPPPFQKCYTELDISQIPRGASFSNQIVLKWSLAGSQNNHRVCFTMCGSYILTPGNVWMEPRQSLLMSVLGETPVHIRTKAHLLPTPKPAEALHIHFFCGQATYNLRAVTLWCAVIDYPRTWWISLTRPEQSQSWWVAPLGMGKFPRLDLDFVLGWNFYC